MSETTEAGLPESRAGMGPHVLPEHGPVGFHLHGPINEGNVGKAHQNHCRHISQGNPSIAFVGEKNTYGSNFCRGT